MAEFITRAKGEENRARSLDRIARDLLGQYSDYIENASDYIRVLELRPIRTKKEVDYRILVKLDRSMPGLVGWGDIPLEVYKDEQNGDVLDMSLFRLSEEEILKSRYQKIRGGHIEQVETPKPLGEKETSNLFKDLTHSVPSSLSE